jgi:ribosomal-protein-alanine N-acetyltransferase
LQITVKRASLKDLESLCKIEKECFSHEAFSRKQIAYFLEASNAVSLVAKVGGEITGFIIGLIEHWCGSRIGHIYTVDVALNYRRMGVGLRLLEEIEKIFMEKGVETCFLEVRTDNIAARRLYQKQGYTELGKLNNYYAKGIHGIRLKKKLKPKQA